MNIKRILLKISGEALQDNSNSISHDVLDYLSEEIIKCYHEGTQIALVVGGGNIHRGQEGFTAGIERVTSDYMGMLATMINALAIQDTFERKGISSRILSAIKIEMISEIYFRRKALDYLEKNIIVIFAAGIGNPYFTTDSAAAIRAKEMNADVLIKATKVGGLYDKDPKIFPDAKFLEQATYQKVLENKLHVMDPTAFTLCEENKMPIMIYNLFEKNSLVNIIKGKSIGSLIK